MDSTSYNTEYLVTLRSTQIAIATSDTQKHYAKSLALLAKFLLWRKILLNVKYIFQF